ncbi:MAG: siroheme synthase CysG [Aquisalinus sp.]|nr:siroheme synthase CysG [Aquisalinus sp.]
MRYFPAFFDLRYKPVLIAGGGEEALRKARLVRKANPSITFVAHEFDTELREEFSEGAQLIQRRFKASDLKGDRLHRPAIVIVATGDALEDERIALKARAKRIPVNVVDRPEFCDFVVPSMVERGDLVIGISTGGQAPVLGRSLRARLEALLPQRLADLTAFASDFRGAVAATLPKEQRRSFWEKLFAGPIADLVLAGNESEAREQTVRLLNQPTANEEGFVHIVGAGPGDPELLTVKALRVLQEADVVLHDNLVTDGILELIRRDATRIYVGKKKADHALPQEQIAEKMIALAREGKRVVRLKGGDPFIFGRGGEELDALDAAGINAAVIPGITAATGCGAVAGVPLTHRDHSQAVTFVTGHAKGDAAPDLDWQSLANLGHTLVVYMGVGTAARTSAHLLKAGMKVTMPVAIIEKGTTPEQKVVRTDITHLPSDIKQAGITGPAILVIGEVAAKASGRGLIDLATAQNTAEKLSA